MTIKVGDKLPSVKLKHKTEQGLVDVSTDTLFDGQKAVLFAVPGAFTPTCSAKHVPSFLNNYEALKAKGVTLVACISVNDAFVMHAWGNDQKVEDKITMLADGNGDFTRAIDLGFDASGFGLGYRSQRYAMVIENGIVTGLYVEQPGAYEVSSGEAVLATL